MAWYDEVPVEAWSDRARDDLEAAEALHMAFMEGQLDHHSAGIDLVEWDRKIGRLLLDIDLNEPSELIRMASDERAVRRWCWAPHWFLLEQDEDLFLMGEPEGRWLAQEAIEGCPKADYATAIVGHALRDHLHHALWPASGAATSDRVDAALDRAARLLPLARATSDGPLVAYVERVASYRNRGQVPERGVVQRILDVRRCHPRPENVPTFERKGRRWVAPLKRANSTPGTLFIDARDGRMWAEEV